MSTFKIIGIILGFHILIALNFVLSFIFMALYGNEFEVWFLIASFISVFTLSIDVIIYCLEIAVDYLTCENCGEFSQII